jgi:hypothetical protein
MRAERKLQRHDTSGTTRLKADLIQWEKPLRNPQESPKGKIELVGTFESDAGTYGPDGPRFRFSIFQVNSATEANRQQTIRR